MNQVILLALTLSTGFVYAEDLKKDTEWNASTLTDKTIKKIQQSQFKYKKCIADEMIKPGYAKIESRSATDAIVKQCEKVLSSIRQDYLDVNVPGIVADRHLKKLRMTLTRRILKQLMFDEAARKSGQK